MQGGKVEQTSSRGFRLETFEHEEPAEAEKTGDGSSSDRATVDRVAGDDPRSGGGVGQANHEETEGMAYEVLPGAAAEGQHTENAAEALATRDRNMQRKVQKLDMRAADLAWAWVAHKKQQGQTIGEVYRPELGPLRTTQVLWELQAQKITGWNTEVRQLITREVLRKVMLSRKVLESIYRFTAKGRAMRLDVPEGELPTEHGNEGGHDDPTFGSSGHGVGDCEKAGRADTKSWHGEEEVLGMHPHAYVGRGHIGRCGETILGHGVGGHGRRESDVQATGDQQRGHICVRKDCDAHGQPRGQPRGQRRGATGRGSR